MKDMFWLIRKTLRSTFRKKKSWIVYFGLPLCGILLSMMLYGTVTGSTVRVGIVNLDGEQTVTQDAIQLVKGLHQTEVTMTDEETLRKKIAAGNLDCGLVFHQGFAASVHTGHPEGLQIVSVKGAQVSSYVKSMLQNYVGNIAAIGQGTQGNQAAFDHMYADYRQQHFQLVAETAQDTSNTKTVTSQTLGYLITFMMFSAVGMTQMILKEKENRTFLRLMTSPIATWAYVLSNVIVNMMILSLQIVVTLVLMKYVFRIDSGVPMFELFPVLFLFGLAAIGLSLLIVSFAKSSSAAGAIENLVITPTCLLAGCFFPMEIMPETVRKISAFLPQHWLLDTINKLQQGQAFGSLSLNFSILLAFALAFSLIAIYKFSRNNDTRMFV